MIQLYKSDSVVISEILDLVVKYLDALAAGAEREAAAAREGLAVANEAAVSALTELIGYVSPSVGRRAPGNATARMEATAARLATIAHAIREQHES
jgi:hypothetical protein